jgi:preprotein translocase subunit SecE
MEQSQDKSRWGAVVFVVVFVASIFLLLADNAMAR